MSDIYKLHSAAFSRVAAFVILDKAGEICATVAIKFPADGAGRLYAYTHVNGCEMTRGYAGGYGYDKRSPAVAEGFAKTPPYDLPGSDPYGARAIATREALQAAFLQPGAAGAGGGEDWARTIEDAGFRVIRAV